MRDRGTTPPLETTDMFSRRSLLVAIGLAVPVASAEAATGRRKPAKAPRRTLHAAKPHKPHKPVPVQS